MPVETHPPSISEKAFECPHCGAYTTQYWYIAGAKSLKDNGPPELITPDHVADLKKNQDINSEHRERLIGVWEPLAGGMPKILRDAESAHHRQARNIHFSGCYNCEQISVWQYDKLIYPALGEGPEANKDMPAEIRADFEEARRIVNISPRGAAALLRLCLQKFCGHLGESDPDIKGKNIDDDIGTLVSKGLNPTIQKALDTVRVIGNEAVHPGTLDLRDGREIALKLFSLVNLIVDQMISHPNAVNALYQEKVPETKKLGILNRDKKKE